MTAEKSSDDCYFYFYSSCTKGEDCPYRHCKEALGTEIVCELWRAGVCLRANCKYRHMESRINRSNIACYWENQPGGCRKPHCVFLHRKAKCGTISDAQSLILPEVSTISLLRPTSTISISTLTPPQVSKDTDMDASDGIHSPVQPLVVSFDGEESDTESVSSTPVKNDGKYMHPKIHSSTTHQKTNLNDLGVKTLEQIKMEKIHKESEHFYKSAYDAPSIESHLGEVELFKAECYPPESEFISLSKEADIDNRFSSSKVESLDEESDLRVKLQKRPLTSVEDGISAKRSISFKKQDDSLEDELNFKIKTLAEIRKERENKTAFHEDNCYQTTPISCHNGKEKSSKKLKIIRRSADSYAMPTHQDKDSPINNEKGIRIQSVLHEVQNTSESQTESKKTDKGKRKAENDGELNNCKLFKPSEAISSDIMCKKEPFSALCGIQSFLRKHQPIQTPNPESSKLEHHTSDEEKLAAHTSEQCIETKVISDSLTHSTSSTPVSLDNSIPKVGETRLSSIDEFDSFLEGTDEVLEEECNPMEDDILTKIEQFLDS